ncbi:MAG: ROK family protein [Actinomycetota bacterium]|nr:ROK family protein [Actinomycetota bacterium]
MGVTIGIDVGGTKVAGARVSPEGKVEGRLEVPTPDDPARFAEVPGQLVEHLLSPEVKAIGMGVAGLVAWPEGRLVWGPNVSGRDVPYRRLLERAFGLPVAVENDANVAGLGEAWLGAGRDYRHVLMVTVGTGIGGGMVVDDTLYRGRSFAGEIGHMVVAPEGPPCGCGRLGCWEQLASGTALTRMAREAAAADPRGSIARLAGNGRPEGEHVTQAAQAGDEAALHLVDRLAGWLGMGLANLIAVLDPEVIVVGGGLGEVGELLLEPVRSATRLALSGAAYRSETPIVPALLSDQAGIIGASLLARELIR